MPKRKTVSAAANSASEAGQEEELVSVAETRRTRSGRTIRTPAALIDSQTPVKTPSRRTRRPVVEELPAVKEQNTEGPDRIPERPVEEPESSEPRDPLTEATDSDLQTSRPAPTETTPATPETIPKKKPHLAPSSRQVPMVPLGKPKSGRVWKDRNKQRFSALVRDKPLCSSWEKKMQARREKELVKLFTARLKQEDAQKKEEKRKRREENLKRREENERRAEIVQVIRNTTKIKRMKKKQLRKIEKRDTLRLLQKSQNLKTKTQKAVSQEFA